jgi:hypothetical protein
MATGHIACVATADGVIIEARGTQSTVSLCLDAEAVSQLVMNIAACASQHAKLAGKQRRRSRK